MRVSNLSEDVKDSDLRELFRRFGTCLVLHGTHLLRARARARAWHAPASSPTPPRDAAWPNPHPSACSLLPVSPPPPSPPPPLLFPLPPLPPPSSSSSTRPSPYNAPLQPTPGAIQRIYLAKDRETQQSRGFAFINFFHKQDAAAAIAKLDGHGYDHLILSVSWANPSAAAPAQKAPGMSAEAFPSLGGSARGGVGSALYSGAASSEARFDKFVHDPGLDRFR